MPRSVTIVLIVDSGPLVAQLNRNDPDHDRCLDLLESYEGDLLITPYVLTETCYLIQTYLGAEAEGNLVEAVAGGDLIQKNLDDDDMVRVVELMRQYQGFPLGITDASVIALAERIKASSVATLDHRHFHAIKPAHTTALTLLP